MYHHIFRKDNSKSKGKTLEIITNISFYNLLFRGVGRLAASGVSSDVSILEVDSGPLLEVSNSLNTIEDKSGLFEGASLGLNCVAVHEEELEYEPDDVDL